jgi:hypothetical protein
LCAEDDDDDNNVPEKNTGDPESDCPDIAFKTRKISKKHKKAPKSQGKAVMEYTKNTSILQD